MGFSDIGFNILARDKGASSAFAKVAKSVDDTASAMAKAEKATEAAAAASVKLQRAQSAEADSIGKVRVAEQKLEEVRKNGKAKASQIAAAEESLAAARRKAASASDSAKDAAKRYSDSETAAATAAKRLADAQEQAAKNSKKHSSGLQNVGKAADSTEKKFGFLAARTHGLTAGITTGFGQAASAIGAFVAVSALKTFVNDARESAKVGRLTAQVIKSTGGAAQVTADQVGDLATAISNKTGADDEAIQSGQNLLLTFTNIRNGVGKGNDIFDQASQSITDMTAALNGGEVTAEGMKSSSIQLGKALNDPIKGVTALSKVGVSFTEQQKKQIKTLVDSGKTMDAQKIILKELGKEFGGAAQAASDPLTKLKTIAGNASEAIGGFLLPAVDKVATWLGKVIPPAVDKAGKFFNEKLLPPLKLIAGFVKDKVVPGFQGLWDLLVNHDFSKEFRKAFHVEEDSGIVSFLLKINEGARSAFANAKKLATGIIDGITTGLKTGHWSKLGTALGDGLMAGIKGVGTGAGKLLDAIGGLVDKVDWGALGTKISTGLRDMLKSVDWKGLGDTIGNSIISIFQKATALGEKVGEAFKELMAKVDWKAIGRDSTDAIGQFIAGVDWGHLAKTLGVAALKSLKLDKTVYDAVVGGISDLIIGMAEEAGRAIAGAFKDAGKWLEQKGRDLLNGLKHGASTQSSGIGTWLMQTVISPVTGAFKDSAKWLVTHGKNLISGLKNGVWAFAQGLDDWMVRAPVAKLLAPWYGAIKWLVGPGRNLIAGFKNGVVDIAKTIGSWVSGSVIRPVVGAFGKAGAWLVQHGRNLVAGFENGISAIARTISGWVSRNVVTPVVSTFRMAGTWLNQQGRNLVAGFKSGIIAIAGTIGRWAYDHVIVPVVRPFGKAIGWLNRAGRDLIGGLTSGITGRMKGIASWIKGAVVDPMVSAVKKFFGIKSPSTVFAGIGGHLIGGLLKGMGSGMGSAVAKKVFGDMPAALRSIVGKGLVSVANLPKKAMNALGSAIGIGQPLGGPKGNNQSNVGIVRTLASQYGWGSGGQWNSLQSLIMGESGFNSNAQNPTSSAYGLFQFLDSTWGSVGATKTADPWGQTIAGLKYIARSYGSPANAYAQWSSRSPHWYEKGTPWVPNDQMAYLHEGEAVVPRKVNEARLKAGGGTQKVVLEFRSDGSPHMDYLIKEFRKYVRVNGGDVQAVLGK